MLASTSADQRGKNQACCWGLSWHLVGRFISQGRDTLQVQELSPDSPEDGRRWEGTQAVHSLKRSRENVASIPSSTLRKYSILMGMGLEEGGSRA